MGDIKQVEGGKVIYLARKGNSEVQVHSPKGEVHSQLSFRGGENKMVQSCGRGTVTGHSDP